MESFTIRMLTLFIICWTLNTGFGLPLLDNPEKRDDSPHPTHIRTKRCSCNSWDDKECIYFCHLDIIWVNTPDKILPYGLGDPRSRRRRSVDRCECLDSADKSCRGFCQQRTDTMGPVTKPEHRNSHKFLAFLRSVIKTNTKIVKGYQSMKNPSRHQKLKNQTRR